MPKRNRTSDDDDLRADSLFERMIDRFDTRAFIAIELATSMVVLTFVMALRVPESDAFKILLGAMLTVGFASAVGWYFNSSAGSDKKDTTQAKVAEELAKKVASNGTGDGSGGMRAAVAAAALAAPAAAAFAAPAAAAIAAPPAAEIAAPPVVEKVAPPLIERAVADAMEAHNEMEKQK